jgi:hypothetical protein
MLSLDWSPRDKGDSSVRLLFGAVVPKLLWMKAIGKPVTIQANQASVDEPVGIQEFHCRVPRAAVLVFYPV